MSSSSISATYIIFSHKSDKKGRFLHSIALQHFLCNGGALQYFHGPIGKKNPMWWRKCAHSHKGFECQKVPMEPFVDTW